jgi:anaerobic selenocysteine-containing dehydrogenase
METVKTICGICELSCGMEVHAESGKVTQVQGLSDDVVSRGDLCVKGKAAREILYAPDRLTAPMRKKNGTWEAISWDEALDLCTEKLTGFQQKYGPESLTLYHGQTYLKMGLSSFCMNRFLNLYGTPNVTSAGSECFIPILLSGLATFGGIAMPDMENSRCILFWGTNPPASGSMTWGGPSRTAANMKRLKDEGVSFIVVDPRVTATAKMADEHVQLRPGTDGALALAMMNVIIKEDLYDKDFVKHHTSGFNELKEMVKGYPVDEVSRITQVPAETITRVARLFATTKPASIKLGTGVEHHTNGTQTIRALDVLVSITGNVDIKGGNNLLDSPFLAAPQVKALGKEPSGAKEHPMFCGMINQSQAMVLMEDILKGDPPLKMMVVAAGSPLPVLANSNKMKQCLDRLDFVVVIDQFMTATAKMADLVLPAAFFLERDEISPRPLNLQRKVVDPQGPWADWKIWWELARKMGYGEHFPWKGFAEAADYLLEPTGVTYKELAGKPEGVSPKDTIGKARKEGFYTYSGKVELLSKSMESNGYNPLPVYEEPAEGPKASPEVAKDFPLILITGGRHAAFIHSQHRNIPSLRKLLKDPLVEIHPETAKSQGVGNGDAVVVESKRGRLTMKARCTDDILPGVVHIPHGWEDGDCNILTDNEQRDPVSGFPALKSSLCRIAKAPA